MRGGRSALGFVLAIALALPAFARVADEQVTRTASDKIVVTWKATAPVDVYVSPKPDTSPSDAKLIARNIRTGRTAEHATGRVYFLLKDTKDGSVARVAERVLPLERGSNFRDLGGYPAANGKHVRWGMLFRSAGTPVLADADVRSIGMLGLKTLVDLRSNEERVLAPTRIDGVPYTAIGYPMAAQMDFSSPPKSVAELGGIYRKFPVLLAPHLRRIFADLRAGDAPLAYNCSAGQDRTGFATAMILSALGVPRDVILADFHLSTRARHPEFEMPTINAAGFPGNAVAAFYAKAQADGHATSPPAPLYDGDHRPLLDYAYEEIQRRWGSVSVYLEQEIGLTDADFRELQDRYLE